MNRKSVCLSVLCFFAAASQAAANESVREALASEIASKRLLLDVDKAGNRLVAVGAFGHVLLSDDQGKNWRQADHVPISQTLTAVHFPSKNIGYAVGHDNVILKTENGGQNWTLVHIDPDITNSVNRARSFSDEPSTCGGKQERDNCLIPMLAVHFLDDDRGIVLGAFGQALFTNDGGKSWEWKPFPPALVKNEFEDPADPNDDYEPFEANLNGIIQTSNGNLYVAAEYGAIYRSTDGGRTFRAMTTGYNGSFWGMIPLGNSVLAYGMRGNVWRSDNDGRSWRRLDTGKAQQSFQDGLRFSNGAIILTGLNGVIAVSRDNGKSFRAFTRSERRGYAALAEGANDNIILFGKSGIQQIRLDQPPR